MQPSTISMSPMPKFYLIQKNTRYIHLVCFIVLVLIHQDTFRFMKPIVKSLKRLPRFRRLFLYSDFGEYNIINS